MLRKLFAILAFCVAGATADAQTVAPPSAAAFAADSSLFSPSLSPSGRYLAVIARQDAGDALLVTDLETGQSATVTSARRNNPAAAKLWLNWVQFKTEDRLVFSVSQAVYARGGEVVAAFDDGPGLDEYRVPRVLSSDRSGGNVKAMFDGQQRRLAAGWVGVSLASINHRDPATVLLSTVGRDGLTLFRANVETGRTEDLEGGTWDTTEWFLDGENNPVLRTDSLPNGSGYKVLRRAPGTRNWVQVALVKEGRDINLPDFLPAAPGPGRGQVYVIARPDDANFASVYLYDAATGQLGAPLFSHPSADAMDGLIDVSGKLIVACAQSRRLQCTGVDAGAEAQLQSLRAHFGANRDVEIVSSSANGAKWAVRAYAPDDPGVLAVFDRVSGRITNFGSTQRSVRGARLAPTEIVTYKTRDGQELFGYLTRHASSSPQATVLLPHGGPESRDTFEYDPLVQLLATRGYAVFQPQFRGSSGFGRAFARSGYRQWGLHMQDDLTDGVNHLVATGVADRARVCIVGASYGGYAALAGVTLTPDVYKCAVSIAGISDLVALLDKERIEAGRGSMVYDYDIQAIGDPNANRDQLVAASPRRLAARVTAPVLLIHGENDGIVPIEQSEYMRDALQAAGRPARYVKILEEGHNFYFWELENRVKLYSEIETFLGANLGDNRPAP